MGTGREFSLMHNPFVTLYVRYARSHLYFAMKLILLCVMLALLDVPGYGSATFGSWMVAISLVTAPFWFNPMQFVMSMTKADYKQWVRWMDGEEVDPDSKLTWYTWHDKMMSKIRNENANMTDHWLNGAKAIISNLFTNGILAIAAISQIKTDEDVKAIEDLEYELMQETDDNLSITNKEIGRKFFLWGAVTLTIAIVFASSALLQSCFRRRGQSKASRVFRALPFLFFVIATISLSEAPNFLETKDGQNGFRNLLLIYYADLQLAIFTIQVMQRTNQDRVSIRHAVDQAYYLLDYFVGVVIFGVLFIFSFTGIMNIIQNTLLFNVSFARSIHNKELVDAIGFERDQDRDDESKAGKERTLGERLSRLMAHDMDGSPMGSPRGDIHKEGAFTRTRSTHSAWRKIGMEDSFSLASRPASFTAGVRPGGSQRPQNADNNMTSWGSLPPPTIGQSVDLSITEVLGIEQHQNEDEKRILL